MEKDARSTICNFRLIPVPMAKHSTLSLSYSHPASKTIKSHSGGQTANSLLTTIAQCRSETLNNHPYQDLSSQFTASIPTRFYNSIIRSIIMRPAHDGKHNAGDTDRQFRHARRHFTIRRISNPPLVADKDTTPPQATQRTAHPTLAAKPQPRHAHSLATFLTSPNPKRVSHFPPCFTSTETRRTPPPPRHTPKPLLQSTVQSRHTAPHLLPSTPAAQSASHTSPRAPRVREPQNLTPPAITQRHAAPSQDRTSQPRNTRIHNPSAWAGAVRKKPSMQGWDGGRTDGQAPHAETKKPQRRRGRRPMN